MKMHAGWMLCLPLLALAQDKPTPELAVSVNDAEEATISPGWPLILDATITSSDGRSVAFGLKDRTWPEAFRIEVRNAGGERVALAWRLVRAWPDTMVAEKFQAAEAIWVLPPDSTAGLAAGAYTVAVLLDAREGAEGWSGSVSARSMRLNVRAEPEPLSKEMDAEKALLQGQYGLLTGALDQALAPLNMLVERQPDLMPALALRGDVHFAAGRWSEALDDYQRAIEIFKSQNPDDSHRPRLLHFKRDRAAAKLGEQP